MKLKTKNTATIGAAIAILAIGSWAEPAHARKHRSGSHERSYQAQSFQPFGWFGEASLKRQRYAAHRSKRADAHRRQQAGLFGFAPVTERPYVTRKERRHAQRADRQPAGVAGFGGSGLVAEARRHLGGNPTGRSSLWCGHFMNLVLQRSGMRASRSNTARSFASYGRRVSGPQVGAIAVMSRGKRGGHVGVVSGIDKSGNPIVISGNHGGRVAEAVYPRGRIFAYVMPL